MPSVIVILCHYPSGHPNGSAGQRLSTARASSACRWAFPLSISRFCGIPHDTTGVGWQEISRMIGAGAMGIWDICAVFLGHLNPLEPTCSGITLWSNKDTIFGITGWHYHLITFAINYCHSPWLKWWVNGTRKKPPTPHDSNMMAAPIFANPAGMWCWLLTILETVPGTSIIITFNSMGQVAHMGILPGSKISLLFSDWGNYLKMSLWSH